jgi:hypothetical protein
MINDMKQFRWVDFDKSKFVDLPAEIIDGKRYYFRNELKYPSVTTVLGARPKKELENWKKKLGEKKAEKIKKRAAKRGDNLHKMAEYYILNNEEEYNKIKQNPFSWNYFKAIKTVLDNQIDDILCSEISLFSDYLKVAGRTDLVGHFDGIPAIIDFKGANVLRPKSYYKSYFMQTAAYSQMFYELSGIKIQKSFLVFSVEGGENQVYSENTDDWIDLFKKERGYFFKIYGN